MAFGLRVMAGVAALLLSGAAAGGAVAQGAKGSAPADVRLAPPPAKSSLKVLEKGRWGLNLNLEEPADRAQRLKDVEAGAFFRITPAMRVGGAVRLDDKVRPDRIQPEERAPRVRLETKFSW